MIKIICDLHVYCNSRLQPAFVTGLVPLSDWGGMARGGRHDAERKAQEAVGVLERQKLKDEIEAEQTRRALLELQVWCSF
jgi:hypothetical protein